MLKMRKKLFFTKQHMKTNTHVCSGYLRKETAVVSIVLPFVYRGLAHFVAHLKNSHQKRKKFLDGLQKKEEIHRWIVK